MATSETPLLSDRRASNSTTSSHHNDTGIDTEPSSYLSKFPALPTFHLPKTSNFKIPKINARFPTPTLPLNLTIHPTVYTRTLALILALPPFILLIVSGSHYSPAITFLSFVLFRQIRILLFLFSSHLIKIHIEIVHERLQALKARAQERWFKNTLGAVVDGIILVGLLVSLAVNAREVDMGRAGGRVEAGVVLGFIVFGLLLVSVPDFGNPKQVTLAIQVDRPGEGLIKVGSSLVFGELDEGENEEAYEYGRSGKRRTYTEEEGDAV